MLRWGLLAAFIAALVVPAGGSAADAGSANVSVEISGPVGVVYGDNPQFLFAVTNNGSADATAVQLSIADATGALDVTGSGCPVTVVDNAFVYRCDAGTLAPGASRTYLMSYAAVAAGTTTLTAAATTTAAQSRTDDDTASLAVPVARGTSDVSVAVTADAEVLNGRNVLHTYRVRNPGTRYVFGQVLDGTLPTNTTGAVATFDSFAGFDQFCQTYGVSTQCQIDRSICVTPGPAGPGTFRCTLSMGPGALGYYNSEIRIRAGGTAAGVGPSTSSLGFTPTHFDDPDAANNSASASTNVVPAANLGAAASAPGNVVNGAAFDYTLTATNAGPDAAAASTATVTLPSGIGVVSLPAGCAGTTTITCDLGAIAAAGSVSRVLGLRATALGSATITTAVASTTAEPAPANNSASATVVVTETPLEPGANVSVAISGPAAPAVGTRASYPIMVRNDGRDPATDVVVDIPWLPSTVTRTTSVGGLRGCTIVVVANAFVQRCSMGTVAPNETVSGTILFDVERVATAAVIATLTTSATDRSTADNSASHAFTSVPSTHDMTVSVSAPAAVRVGRSYQTTFAVRNNGSGYAYRHTLTGTVPAGLASWNLSMRMPFMTQFCQSGGSGSVLCQLDRSTCTYPTTPGATTFTCTLDLGPGMLGYYNSTIEIVVTATGAVPGPAPIGATVTSSDNADPDPTDNAATSATQLEARTTGDLRVTHTAPATAVLGALVPYTVTVTNLGPETVTDVRQTQSFPVIATYHSVTGAPSGCTGSMSSLTCPIGSLAPGESKTLVWQVRSTSLGQATAMASASTADVDPDSGNDSANATTRIVDALPLIACPADASASTDPGAPTATVAVGTATASGGTPPLQVAGTRSDGLALGAGYPVGATRITWTVTDAATQTASCTQTIAVTDDEQPAVAVGSSPEPNGAGWNRDDVTVTVTASDNVGPAVVRYSLDSGPEITAASPATITITRRGTTSLTVFAVDTSGNRAAEEQRTVRIDSTAPTAACAAADGTWHAANVSVECAATDDGSGIDGDPVATLSTTVAAGEETADARTGTRSFCDVAGNCVDAGPVGGNKVDRKPPEVFCDPTEGGGGWQRVDITVGCGARDGGSGVDPDDAAFDLSTDVAEGVETDSAETGRREVCDAVGNCATAGPISGLKVDRKAPVVACPAADDGWHGDNVVVACDVTDAGSGAAASVSLRTSVAVGEEDASASTGTVEICDAVGNCGSAGPLTGFKIDRKRPEVSCDGAPAGWRRGNVAVACRAADTGSGIAGDATFELTTDVAEGEETAEASTGSQSVCDAVGNCGGAGPVGGIAVDRKAPAVFCDVTSDGGGWHAVNVEIPCTATDGGSGVVVDDRAFRLSTDVEQGVETDSAETGSREACDAVGNCATAGPLGGYKVDRRAPTIDCAAAPDGWLGDNASIDCAVADGGSGVAAPSFTLATTVAEGEETASAATNEHRACDSVGNCATVGPLAPIKVDRAPPRVSCGEPDTLWHRENVAFACTAEDATLDGPATFTLATAVPGGEETADAFTPSRSVCDAFARCTQAGPIGPVKVDGRAPVLTVPAPVVVDATSPRGAQVRFAATATDGADPAPAVSCSPASGSTFPFGTTTVTCTALDAAGNTSPSGTFTVHVRDAAEQLARLVEKTARYLGVHGMQAPLALARRALADPRQACTALRAYVTTVTSAVRARALLPAQASDLTADAERIRGVLGCT